MIPTGFLSPVRVRTWRPQRLAGGQLRSLHPPLGQQGLRPGMWGLRGRGHPHWAPSVHCGVPDGSCRGPFPGPRADVGTAVLREPQGSRDAQEGAGSALTLTALASGRIVFYSEITALVH